MTPRIGVDLDGVVYDWQGAFVYLANKHLDAGLNTNLSWWKGWNAPDEHLTVEEQDWLWTVGIDLGLFRYGHHLKGSVDGLREIAEIGELHVVTHRPRAALQDTLRFISNLPDVFSGVHFLTNAEPKSSVGLDVYLDDGPHVIGEVLDAGAKGVVFDQPWNRVGCAHFPHRAFGWDDVPERLKEALA